MTSIRDTEEIHLEDSIIEYEYEYNHENEARDRSTPEYKSVEIFKVLFRSEGTGWNNIDITEFVNTFCDGLYEELEQKIYDKYEL
tara:strand:+ start:2122 stop:2376 length:255 start_codon:yes stop_codon:yes gene_type:complete